MKFDVELFRGPGQEFFGDVELDVVLHRAAVRHVGDQARRARIRLQLEGPADPEPYPGPPEVYNLTTTGYCRLQVTRGGETIVDERLRLTALLGPVLVKDLCDREPEETQWGFLLRRQRLTVIIADSIDHLTGQFAGLERPVPEIKGAIDVDLSQPRHRPFALTPMADEDAQLVQPEELGLDPDRLGRINILMSEDIYDQFLRRMPLTDRMEEGGFLLGKVTKAAADVHLVDVTHITPAHRSGAGVVHFTFTGESFLAVAQLIEERGQEEELVGWYHTHLFGIDLEMGLSEIDVDLHRATFQRPWQVAALINIRRGRRFLRFYGRGGGDGLEEYDQWICDDSARYRLADPAVGSG